jgi:hypothetical protein
MAEAGGSSGHDEPAVEKVASGKASETLSQFVARVLTQLSLSAWLPSASLVLSLAFVIQLGKAADSAPSAGVWTSVGIALGSLTKMSIGGAPAAGVGR